MPHGPAYFPSKGACIYCGETGVRLADEHVVPYSLGGSHVLREASCGPCAKMTLKFEQLVARDLWGDARTSYGGPTRRKRERPTHIEAWDPQNPSRRWKVPVGEYPASLVFYKMCQAGILQGHPEGVDLSPTWQLVATHNEERVKRYREKYRADPVLKFRHVPQAFGRLLAKIGYCNLLTMLDPGDFQPICLPYIRGKKPNCSYVVGGSLESQTPDPSTGYKLETAIVGRWPRALLVTLIRLYANGSTPAYHVVVGEVEGEEEVRHVLNKLGAGSVLLDVAAAPQIERPHWEPPPDWRMP